MESVNLLVTDRSPESAERINSMLRNSGIKIHVIHTPKVLDVKRALDHDLPLLILYSDTELSTGNIEEVSSLAHQYQVPFALYSDFSQQEEIFDFLKTNSCLVIHSEHESQLADTVNRLITQYELGRGQTLQKSQLEELEHRYDLLLESARDAMAYVHQGLHVYANRAYLEALHVKDLEDISGLSLLELMSIEGVDLKKVLQGLSKGEYPKETLQVSIKRPDGSEFDANLSFSPAKYHGEECTQMLVHECDAAAGLAAELERLRVIDPLTQLLNKRSFAESLDVAMAEPRSVDSVSGVLYIEPDGMTELHEELEVGSLDALILDLAQLVSSRLSKDDLAARISDNGFAVLTRRDNMEQIEALGQELLSAFSSHLAEVDDRSLSVSCSIGIAALGRLAKNATQVIAGARKAQLEASASGNLCVTFRPQLIAVSSFEDDRQWVDRIKLALGQQDFYSVQQSIIDLEGEGERLMENLTYMRDDAGDLPPHKYMAIADRNDLAGQIDRQMIPALLRSFVETSDKQIISISGNSIMDYSFPGWLHDQMAECCVDPGKLILQISVTAAQSNLKPVQRLMSELQKFGCRLSLSGFDAERRTRQVLEHLEVSFVKLQPVLTEKLTGNATAQEIIRSIVDAAEARNACIIADEVADTSSLAVLWQCGVKLIAGAFLKENSQVVGQ